ncbi:MAG: GC-type dockerin domain-anchored protein [Phycisphaerales bacterium]
MTTRHLALTAILAASPALAGPDVVAGDILSPAHFGPVGDIHAYSFAATACNLGDTDLAWNLDTTAHPVIIENLYRVHDGRLEQVGLSFAQHVIIPLQGNLCAFCTPPQDASHLGAGCSNTDSAQLASYQPRLAPRAGVNASTGVFPFPFAGLNADPASVIDRRLQVPESLLTPGDQYFAELQYVAADDASAGAGANNASSRALTLLPNLSFALLGSTQSETPAILAWADSDPDVVVQTVDIEGDGRFHIAAKVVDQGDGTWRYHYVIHNQSSNLSAAGIYIPVVVAQVYDPDFHAPQYHSGSPVSNDPWAFWIGNASVAWFTDPYSPGNDQSANAVRWGTTYTFSLTTESRPTTSDVTIALFRPGGVQSSFTVPLPTPGLQFCSGADIAEPFGQLDFSDVVAFLTAFSQGLPIADYAEPFGQFDFSDVVAFLSEFAEGCP